MNYAKRIFSIFILFIISQIGITAFGVIKQLSLDAGEKNLNISSTLVTVILVVINILFLIYLAKRMNIIKTNHPFLTKKKYFDYFSSNINRSRHSYWWNIVIKYARTHNYSKWFDSY